MARVLVIDDDEMTRTLVIRMLGGLAFQEAFGKVR
jgi:CheY-like chemotaxis protein